MRINASVFFFKVILIFSFAAISFSETFEPDTSVILISGELSPTVAAGTKPYLVVGDITVPPGVTVKIEPGTVFLFKDFTGFQVHGTLLAEGTREKPIIFTSDNDRKYMQSSTMPAAPYDWNGITIYENALGTRLVWCSISYSLFGINSLTHSFSLGSCLFQRNGKSDLVLEGLRVQITTQPFTYNATKRQVVESSGGNQNSINIGKGTLRAAGFIVCIAGLAGGAWKTVDFQKADRSLTEFGNLMDNSTTLNSRTLDEQWETLRLQRQKQLLYMCAGYGVALLGATGMTLTFFF